MTTTDPNAITPATWFPPEVISAFANKWVLIQLPDGADFGKFVPESPDSGSFYDAAGNKLTEWPNWSPLPAGSGPDPRLVKTPPTPAGAPITVTILKPAAADDLVGLLQFALAKADGFDLTSPAQPEWDQYIKRAEAALASLQSVDQLRSLFPVPIVGAM